MEKHILINGPVGYMRSQSIVKLYNSGFRTIIVDNLCNALLKNKKGVKKSNKKQSLYQY
tara:strand:+ start:145 stop:321 length:177 start_codon:yes stop_codon:yes gene_type:complete